MNYTFKWTGVDQSGLIIQGSECAENYEKLRLKLQVRSITVLKIKKQNNHLKARKKKISSKLLADFSRQIAILIQAKVDLINSLQIIIQEQKHPHLITLLKNIKLNIEQGHTFADTLKQYPLYFDKVYCGLIHAGEQSGTLGEMLQQLADHQDKMLHLRSKIIKALFYPTAVALIALSITVGLLIFVVPQFKNIFMSFGAQLPWFTQVVLHLSSLVQKEALKIILIIGCLIMTCRFLSEKFSFIKSGLDLGFLKIPFVGKIILSAFLTQWASILATLLTAGLSLIDSLEIAQKTVTNLTLQSIMESVQNKVSSGALFYQALSSYEYFPQRCIQMIAIGENSGQLALMLQKIADGQQRSLDDYVDYFSKWLEPITMIFLAIITGSLIIAMYLPVFKLGAAL